MGIFSKDIYYFLGNYTEIMPVTLLQAKRVGALIIPIMLSIIIIVNSGKS